jgi:hypothetical protein
MEREKRNKRGRKRKRTNRLSLKLHHTRLLIRLLPKYRHNNLPGRLVVVDAALNELLLFRLNLLGADEEVAPGAASFDVDCEREERLSGWEEGQD